jgi:starch-binding outer membrane protein, SusD/RagB family
MLNKKISFYLILVALITFSCKKEELFQNPQNSIGQEDAFSTADRIEKASVGMYDALQNANFFSGRILIYADTRGLDAIPNTFFGNLGFYTTLAANDGTVAAAWQAGYRTIYQSNLFIKGFTPKASLVSAAKADQYIGEAKFIRSLCYFYLVNHWAQPYQFTPTASHLGVPLTLTAADDPFAASNQIPRSSVKQVYDQIEADLLEAETKLPLTNTDAFTKVSRATKGAARALLMRLYLYKGDLVKANTYADLIINNAAATGYALNAAPVTTFRTPYTTTESIFSVAMSGADNPNTNNSLGQHYNPRARGDIGVSLAYLALMDTSRDLRYKTLMEKYNGGFWSTKYAGLTTDFVPVFRYAEVLLTKAEILAKQAAGVDAASLAIINTQIRSRSLALPITALTKQGLVDSIIRERRIELAFEGQGAFEFNRNSQDLPAHSTVSLLNYGNDYRILPIPKYDLDKNPNLVPNPGY